MKLFIAGIRITNAPHNPLLKAQYIIDSLPQIIRDAKNTVGIDVVTMIVLSEYELTTNSITKKLKNDCLRLLHEAVKKYKNVILIPGSLSSYQQLSDYSNMEAKKKKILDNYMNNYPRFTINGRGNQFFIDRKYTKSYQDALHQLSAVNIGEKFCLQNSAYILSSDSNDILKHKKSSPFKEKTKVQTLQPSRYLYEIDKDNSIKFLTINSQQLGIHLIICREHCMPMDNEIKSNPPAIEVVVSNTISTYKEFLYGAVNVHMDASAGLKVYINNKHPKLTLFNAIKAGTYIIHARVKTPVKSNTTLTYFNSDFTSASKPIYILEHGLSPLHCAVLTNKESIATHLLDNGANPDSIDNDLNTPAHFAAENDNENIFSMLVKANQEVVNTKNKYGDTPITIANFRKSARCTEFLLKNIINPSLTQHLTSTTTKDHTQQVITKGVKLEPDQDHASETGNTNTLPSHEKTNIKKATRTSFANAMNFWKSKEAVAIKNESSNHHHSKFNINFYNTRSSLF